MEHSFHEAQAGISCQDSPLSVAWVNKDTGAYEHFSMTVAKIQGSGVLAITHCR